MKRRSLLPRGSFPIGSWSVLCLLGVLTSLSGCRAENRLVIGSKSFSEQVILGEMVAQQIENQTGLEVDRRFNLGGTLICHQALRAGELDAYVEYSGTALTAILKMDVINDPDRVYRRVREEYRKFGLQWLDPLGFNNTHVILVRGSDARRLDLKTVSDLLPHTPQWRPGFGYEFKERKDGLQGLVQSYGMEFGSTPRFMELGLLYKALASGQIDVAAGNSTDGLIEEMDLVALEDDRRYFPPYDAGIVIREDTLERHPALLSVLSILSGTLSEEEMRRLNYQVDVAGESTRAVARRFLSSLER